VTNTRGSLLFVVAIVTMVSIGTVAYQTYGSTSAPAAPTPAGGPIVHSVSLNNSSLPFSVYWTANPASGVANVEVNFTVFGYGGARPYSEPTLYTDSTQLNGTAGWTCGPLSNESCQTTIPFAFPANGTYPVLVVVDDVGTAAQFWANYTVGSVIPPSPFSVYWSASPSAGGAPLAVNFTVVAWAGVLPLAPAGLDINGTIVNGSGNWTCTDFNGTSSCVLAIGYTFTQNGTYPVFVEVNDSSGHSAAYFDDFWVGPYNLSLLQVSLSAWTYSGAAPLIVTFCPIAANGYPPYSYRWTFGDGGMGRSTGNITYTYQYGGSYMAEVVAYDAHGNWGTAEVTINVTGPGPGNGLNVTATANRTSGPAPLAVLLIANATGGCYGFGFDFQWSFGDGSANATGQEASHVYTSPGEYSAIATVQCYVNGTLFGSAWASVLINVTQNGSSGHGSGNGTGDHPLTAQGSLVSVQGTTRVTATFQLEVSGGTRPYSIQFSFGDGTWGVGTPGALIVHVYATPGSYRPTATVVDGNGTARAVDFAAVVVTGSALPANTNFIPSASLVYAAVAGMLVLTGAVAVFLRQRSQRRYAELAEGRAIVEELRRLRPPG
jgi:PKD repeat protein